MSPNVHRPQPCIHSGKSILFPRFFPVAKTTPSCVNQRRRMRLDTTTPSKDSLQGVLATLRMPSRGPEDPPGS